MKRQIFLLILLLTSFSSYSFNCKKAALPVDFVICSSDTVFKVNEAHEKAWFKTRARLDNQQKKELVILQKEWLNTFPLKCNIAIKGKAPKTICLVPKLRLGMPTLQAPLAIYDKMKQNIQPSQSWDVAVIKSSMKPIRTSTP